MRNTAIKFCKISLGLAQGQKITGLMGMKETAEWCFSGWIQGPGHAVSSLLPVVSLQAANQAKFSVPFFLFCLLFFPTVVQRSACYVLSIIFNKKQWQASILR